MRINKEAKSFGMSWEKEYGYSQAIKVDNTIYVSGQVSHDERGNIVGPGIWTCRCAKPTLTSRRCSRSMVQQ